jgi:hypothetical protein
MFKKKRRICTDVADRSPWNLKFVTDPPHWQPVWIGAGCHDVCLREPRDYVTSH